MIKVIEPENYYHIYNHAVGSEKLFLTPENYFFFLEKYKFYIRPIAYTTAYCLLPNHFHFLIKVKNKESLKGLYSKNQLKQEFFYSRQFGRFFSCYTQAFNRQQMRMGSLFMKNYKRKKVKDIGYLKTIIKYIHLNPVKHNLSKNPTNWRFSSYWEIINDKIDVTDLDQVFEVYNSIEEFNNEHEDSLKFFKEMVLKF